MALLGGRAGSDRPIHNLLIIGFCAAASAAIRAHAAGEPAQEYEVKAAFLYNITKFVEWPGATHIGTEGTLVVGVLGEDPFGRILDRAFGGKTVNGRSLTIRRFATPDDLVPTHVLFISRSEVGRMPEILERLRGLPVLTVGEADGLAERGVIINFILQESRVRFEINPEAAKQAGLRLSSKLLGVATIVAYDPERTD